MNELKTVGDLIDFLSKYDRDMPIHSDNTMGGLIPVYSDLFKCEYVYKHKTTSNIVTKYWRKVFGNEREYTRLAKALILP